ncbi:peptide ligase PGM1-related protein [Streptomyces sp. NPDC014793]|uniref:preATP grasp domain-containing protein n=1 Tax=Streptomyces sp. NPDC014793 TaxID=3364914 RepID=UPI0036FA501C
MTRLLVGNDFIEELDDADEDRRATARWYAKRTLFYARPGDVLVLPEHPDEAFLAYVTSLIGTDASTLRIVAPPEGLLSADVLRSAELAAAVRTALADRTVDSVVMLHPDPAAVDLARALGAIDAVPGHEFIGQGGGALVNSKAVFRALAAGCGAPVPEGAVCSDPGTAVRVISGLFARGWPVIIKHEYRQATKGNEILTPSDIWFTPCGAPRSVTLTDEAGIANHLEKHWARLTSCGRHRLVVERYVPDSDTVFAEYRITDAGVEVTGQGDLVYAPTPDKQIMPSQKLSHDQLRCLLHHSRRLSGQLHAMGYRGMVGHDAVLTPDGEILFTEFNCRTTGTTHLYSVIGERVVGADYPECRVILEHVGWRVPSLQAAVSRLAATGLAYDPVSRVGVVLSEDFDPAHGDVFFCAIAEDLDAATACEKRVLTLFPEI